MALERQGRNKVHVDGKMRRTSPIKPIRGNRKPK